MTKSKHTRPDIEALESMTLLSGIAGASLPAVAALKAAAAVPNPLDLAGSIHGAFKANATGGGSARNASGSVQPLGRLTFTGSLSAGDAGTLTGTSTKLGKLFVMFQVTPAGQSLTGTYTITGGTKSLAGETGSGVITVNTTGKGFSATFVPSPSATPSPTPTPSPKPTPTPTPTPPYYY
jgi:hypothetical protein